MVILQLQTWTQGHSASASVPDLKGLYEKPLLREHTAIESRQYAVLERTSWQDSSARMRAAWPVHASMRPRASSSPGSCATALGGAQEDAAIGGHSMSRVCADLSSPVWLARAGLTAPGQACQRRSQGATALRRLLCVHDTQVHVTLLRNELKGACKLSKQCGAVHLCRCA